MNLRGQIAVVTGGAAGLGRHIVRVLAGEGAHVVIGDLDPQAGRSAVAEVEAAGEAATFVTVDVTHDEQLGQLIQVAARLGPIRALVNNAGGWGRAASRYPRAAPSEWSHVLDLNLRAPMLATQLCLEPMASGGGGAVINVASSAGIGPDAYVCPAYGAAKAGLIRFTSSVRDLAASRSSRVNCIVPDWIGLDRARREYGRLSPRQRALSGGLIDPDVVAAEVNRLVTDDESAGLIVGIRADHGPYRLDPRAVDPHWPS